MNEVMICDTSISIKEYKGQRVVTFKDIDAVHDRPDGTARRNFNINKEHFIEGEDYFKICVDEIRMHKIMDISSKAREDITLITESGYLMLVKSFTDDLAWTVQRALVKTYFKVQELAVADTELLGEITTLRTELEATRKLALYTARSLPQPPDYRLYYNNVISPLLNKIADYIGRTTHKEVLAYIYDNMTQHSGFDRVFAMNRLKSKYPNHYVNETQPSIIDSIIEFPDYYQMFMKTYARIEKDYSHSVESLSKIKEPDKIQVAINPLIEKLNDHSAHGIKTYGIIYDMMGSKASWICLMRRMRAKTKKEVVLARPDKYELFCACLSQMMQENI